MARFALLLCGLAVLVSPAGAGASTLSSRLKSLMNQAGSASGAYVMDAGTNKTLFAYKPAKARILASNTKLFTSSTVLAEYGPDGSLATQLIGHGSLTSKGVWKGSIYLRGGGDPTFGSRAFARRAYGSDASVEDLADELATPASSRSRAPWCGDESLFDSLRGGPDSGYGTSVWVGPLSAIGFDRGLANSRGTAFQKNPPQFAAAKLNDALEKRGIKVRGKPRTGVAPAEKSFVLAEVRSPEVSRLLTIQNKESDNYFAEMLSKGLPVAIADGRLAAAGGCAGAGDAHALRAGCRARTRRADRDRAPRRPARRPRWRTRSRSACARTWWTARACPTRTGRRRARWPSCSTTSATSPASRRCTARCRSPAVTARSTRRMRHGAARGRCRAKTGTLTGVSALSGYCKTRGGRTLVFSLLMNSGSLYTAHDVQDRIANALARWKG